MICLAGLHHCHRMAKPWPSGHTTLLMEMVLAVVTFASSNGIMNKEDRSMIAIIMKIRTIFSL
jgi:hypothetical protein